MKIFRKGPAVQMTDSERAVSTKILWRSILGIVMVSAGCACFVLSCVAAMVLSSRE